jgi:hypothetical protein
VSAILRSRQALPASEVRLSAHLPRSASALAVAFLSYRVAQCICSGDMGGTIGAVVGLATARVER